MCEYVCECFVTVQLIVAVSGLHSILCHCVQTCVCIYTCHVYHLCIVCSIIYYVCMYVRVLYVLRMQIEATNFNLEIAVAAGNKLSEKK